MPWWADVLISLGALIAISWLALIVVLRRAGVSASLATEAARLLPDLLRLVARLARDSSLPRGVRWRLWLLLAYLASPLDLVPDFLPVIGYADDAVIVAIALRSVLRTAGVEAIEQHWPGSPDGLLLVLRLAGRR
ncbi:MAG: DUF1232 domain-containing protein [Frankiaceae bacterium]|nr:DUF1232 domain-containing protein [Frankiaceae bacterium]